SKAWSPETDPLRTPWHASSAHRRASFPLPSAALRTAAKRRATPSPFHIIPYINITRYSRVQVFRGMHRSEATAKARNRESGGKWRDHKQKKWHGRPRTCPELLFIDGTCGTPVPQFH